MVHWGHLGTILGGEQKRDDMYPKTAPSTSVLTVQVGLFPSKDTYYSNATEVTYTPIAAADDCPFNNFSEPFPFTHHAAAVLSAGLVQPSDAAGAADNALLFTAVRSDGTLLKPDRPAISVPTLWPGRSFGDTVPPGPVGKAALATYTVVGGYAWHYLFTVALAADYNFTDADFFIPDAYTATVTPWA